MLIPNALDEALRLQVADGALPALVVGPGVAPHVQLLQVEAVDAEVLQALFGVLADVVGVERRRKRGTWRGRAISSSLAAPLWRRRASFPHGAGWPRRAAVRCAPSRTQTPCRRSCTRAQSPDRAPCRTHRHQSPTSRPCPTCRSRLPRPAIRACRIDGVSWRDSSPLEPARQPRDANPTIPALGRCRPLLSPQRVAED